MNSPVRRPPALMLVLALAMLASLIAVLPAVIGFAAAASTSTSPTVAASSPNNNVSVAVTQEPSPRHALWFANVRSENHILRNIEFARRNPRSLSGWISCCNILILSGNESESAESKKPVIAVNPTGQRKSTQAVRVANGSAHGYSNNTPVARFKKRLNACNMAGGGAADGAA